jgi:hypothetical protein
MPGGAVTVIRVGRGAGAPGARGAENERSVGRARGAGRQKRAPPRGGAGRWSAPLEPLPTLTVIRRALRYPGNWSPERRQCSLSAHHSSRRRPARLRSRRNIFLEAHLFGFHRISGPPCRTKTVPGLSHHHDGCGLDSESPGQPDDSRP